MIVKVCHRGTQMIAGMPVPRTFEFAQNLWMRASQMGSSSGTRATRSLLQRSFFIGMLRKGLWEPFLMFGQESYGWLPK